MEGSHLDADDRSPENRGIDPLGTAPPFPGHCVRWGLSDQLVRFIKPSASIRACAAFQPNYVPYFLYLGPLGIFDFIRLWLAIKGGGAAKHTLWVLTTDELVVLEIDNGVRKRHIKRQIGWWRLSDVTGERIRPKGFGRGNSPFAMRVRTPDRVFEVCAETFDDSSAELISYLCE